MQMIYQVYIYNDNSLGGDIDKFELADKLLGLYNKDGLNSLDNITDSDAKIELDSNRTYGELLNEINRVIVIIHQNSFKDILLENFIKFFKGVKSNLEQSINTIFYCWFIVSSSYTSEEIMVISNFLEEFDILKEENSDTQIRNRQLKGIISETDVPDIKTIIDNHGISKFLNNISSLPNLKTLNLDCIIVICFFINSHQNKESRYFTFMRKFR